MLKRGCDGGVRIVQPVWVVSGKTLKRGFQKNWLFEEQDIFRYPFGFEVLWAPFRFRGFSSWLFGFRKFSGKVPRELQGRYFSIGGSEFGISWNIYNFKKFPWIYLEARISFFFFWGILEYYGSSPTILFESFLFMLKN